MLSFSSVRVCRELSFIVCVCVCVWKTSWVMMCCDHSFFKFLSCLLLTLSSSSFSSSSSPSSTPPSLPRWLSPPPYFIAMWGVFLSAWCAACLPCLPGSPSAGSPEETVGVQLTPPSPPPAFDLSVQLTHCLFVPFD